MDSAVEGDILTIVTRGNISGTIVNAEMKLRASIMRKESRCSHYGLDFPQPDTKNWNVWINIYKGSDGTMKLEKQAFGSWPA